MTHLAMVRRLIEVGALNHPGSTQVDRVMALGAFETAVRLDHQETPPMPDLLAVLDEADCWCGRTSEECSESGGCRWTKALAEVERGGRAIAGRALGLLIDREKLRKELESARAELGAEQAHCTEAERAAQRAEVASLEALADGTRARAEQTRQRAEHLRAVLTVAEVDDALREAGVVHPLGVAGVRDLGDLFAGQVQRAEEAEAVLTSAWLYEVLHVVWGFAGGEASAPLPQLTRAHAQSALSQVPDEVLVAAQITRGGGQ